MTSLANLHLTESLLMTKILSCLVCDKDLHPSVTSQDPDTPVIDAVPPLDGLVFIARGNYGSSIFDPVGDGQNASYLEINICDDCVTEKHKNVREVRLNHHVDTHSEEFKVQRK